MSHTSLVDARNLTKSFTVAGEQTAVLQDVSFSLTAGEFACFIGPSGCGKSTLLRILAGLESADAGSLTLNRKSNLAMVFQNFALFPWLTVAENISFGLRMHHRDEKVIAKETKERIIQMGLQRFEDKHPKELSGGMKQRVGIARALTMKPDLLLMDEPFSALDAFTAEKLRTELLGVWADQHMTIAHVTHLVEEAVMLADRIFVFSPRPGRIIHTMTVTLARPRDKRSPEFYRLVDQLQSFIEQD